MNPVDYLCTEVRRCEEDRDHKGLHSFFTGEFGTLYAGDVPKSTSTPVLPSRIRANLIWLKLRESDPDKFYIGHKEALARWEEVLLWAGQMAREEEEVGHQNLEATQDQGKDQK